MVSTLKSVAKGAAVQITARAAPWVWRVRRPGSLVILAYHRVLPPDSPLREREQPSMCVTPDRFDRQLGELRRHFEIVDLAEWLARSRRGNPLPRRACALTFDDGWRDNYEYALPLLVKHGAPATVFLVADHLGASYPFWPNRLMLLLRLAHTRPDAVGFPERLHAIVQPVLAAAAARGTLTTDDIDRAVQRAKALDELTIRDLVGATTAPFDEPSAGPDLLDREEIRRMAATGLVRFGSHTATHFRLGGDPPAAVLEREIVGSRRTLQALTGQAIELFCYPNGELSTAATDCVRTHYLGAVSTRGGWVPARPDPHLLPRIGIHDGATHTRAGFVATLSGWI